MGSVRQILIEEGEPLLEIGGAGNQLFDIVEQGRGVCDDDLGMIEVLVERSQEAASAVLRRRLDTVIAVTRATVRGMWWSKKTALVARSKERRLSTTSVSL